MNTPHAEQLSTNFKEYVKDNKDFVFKMMSLLDNMFPWLVGISTAGITLIFSSLDKINFVNPVVVRVTLGALALSVLLGIFSRILFAIANFIGFYIYIQFEMGLKILELPLNPPNLEGNESAEHVSSLLIEDFKFDMRGNMINWRQISKKLLVN